MWKEISDSLHTTTQHLKNLIQAKLNGQPPGQMIKFIAENLTKINNTLNQTYPYKNTQNKKLTKTKNTRLRIISRRRSGNF